MLIPVSRILSEFSLIGPTMIEQERYGWGIRHSSHNPEKWEVYEWERLTELHIHTQTISGLFDQKWQAEHYLNLLKRR